MNKKIAIPVAVLALVGGLATGASVTGNAPWSASAPEQAAPQTVQELGPDVALPLVQDVENPAYADVKAGDITPEHPGKLTDGLSALEQPDGTFLIVDTTQPAAPEILDTITEQARAVPVPTTVAELGAQAQAREAAATTALDGTGKVLVIVASRDVVSPDSKSGSGPSGFEVWMKQGTQSQVRTVVSRAEADQVVAEWTSGDPEQFLVVDTSTP